MEGQGTHLGSRSTLLPSLYQGTQTPLAKMGFEQPLSVRQLALECLRSFLGQGNITGLRGSLAPCDCGGSVLCSRVWLGLWQSLCLASEAPASVLMLRSTQILC